MASQDENKEDKRDALGTPVDEMFAGWTDSDDETNMHHTPGLIHVHNSNAYPHSSTPNTPNPYNSTPNGSDINLHKQIPKAIKQISVPSQQKQSESMRLDNIVSTLFDMKTHIKNQSKVAEFERLIDLILLKFNEMQAEKFNLLEQITTLERENDKLFAQTTETVTTETVDDEFKDVIITGALKTEQSVILVDYWTDNLQKNKSKSAEKTQKNKPVKSAIAPWTKCFARHKTGIGEDLRIAIISSQKLLDTSAYNDQYFEETLQNIKIKCYFPKLFAELRALFDISLPQFLSSFKASHLLQINKCHSSLSGSQFFYSFDGKYVIKSMRREEVTFIKQMLSKYCKYMEKHKQKSFISTFFAMFKIINNDNNGLINAQMKPTHFIVMNCIYYESDMFDVPLNIYDIKGSEYNRITEDQMQHSSPMKNESNAQNKNESISILKDHEWMEKGTKLEIGDADTKKNIQIQLFNDIQFLKSLQIMDYSLVIGVYKNRIIANETQKYFIGIIDVLQHYDIWKQFEGNGAYYILGIEGYDIVDPQQYANRLWKFVTTYIL